MALLKNARHERYAQNIVKGLSGSESYRQAGFAKQSPKSTRAAAGALAMRKDVQDRIQELRDRAVNDVLISRQKILEELAAIAFAKIGDEFVRTGEKRQALMDIAKLEGWIIERSEIGDPGDFERMSDTELEQYLVNARQLASPRPGLGVVIEHDSYEGDLAPLEQEACEPGLGVALEPELDEEKPVTLEDLY